jgi:hypothetical protein
LKDKELREIVYDLICLIEKKEMKEGKGFEFTKYTDIRVELQKLGKDGKCFHF